MKRCGVVAVLLSVVWSFPCNAQGVRLPDAERVVLENGAVLILVEKHDVPLIGLETVIRGGAAADPEDRHGTANLLAALLEKGAGERSAEEFAATVEGVGGTVAASAGVEWVNVSAEFMARDAALMVELVADMLIRPTLDAGEFVRLRDRSVNLIKAAKGSDPNNLMPAYANAFLFGDHPYGNPAGGSETSLAAMQLGDLKSYYDDYFGADRLIVVASGDFESAEMRDLLSAAFGNWRAAGRELPEFTAPEKVPESRVLLIDKPGATQTYFRIGNVGVARDYSGRANLNLANTVFGGRFTSMLMTELRTKSGLSYSARSQLGRYSQPGSVFIGSFTEVGTTIEAIDTALGVLGQLHENGLNDAMLQSAKNYVQGQFPTRLETAAQLAAQFAMLEAAGLDASWIDDYGTELDAATPESIAAVIDDVYPRENELVFVVLGDAEHIRESLAKYGPVTEVSIDEPRFRP